MSFDLTDPNIPRLIVTGHPNHELAIFGFVQRAKPHLLFLTDGGGQQRVDESRRALASIDALDRARFLGWTEQTLYDALLDTDLELIEQLIAAVRAQLVAVQARQVICEAVELYNPLHDITLPIVRAAARGIAGLEVIEFPLIAQEPAESEQYRIQRFPAGHPAEEITLTAAELDVKLNARNHEYATLRHTMGGVIDRVSRERAGTEVFARAAEELPTPGRDHILRYEWRGELLRERGEVERVITFAGHFLPIAKALAKI